MTGTKIISCEVIELRKAGWEGIPPPPVFAARKPKLFGTSQKDPNKTPAAISLGLPNVDLEPRIPPHPTSILESITVPEAETTPTSPPITQSPSISVSTLSDFTLTDTSDDQSPVDPTAITPHDTFYLEDGNVEVLCGNTLFRLHTNVLSFHSPALRQGFSQAVRATLPQHSQRATISSVDASLTSHCR